MLRAIIVDDEAPARSEMRYILGESGQVEVVAEASSVREAIKKLGEYPCDVVFLDVNMPEASGLQLAEALRRVRSPIAVVFVTAYGDCALEAFKVNALDCLVKPVESDRLQITLERVRDYAELIADIHRVVSIPVDKGGHKTSVRSDQVRYAVARDDYSYLSTGVDHYFSAISLAKLEKMLDGRGFFRSHRGYLVNLSFVEEVETASSGALLLTLDGIEEKTPVARRRAPAMKRTLGI